MVVDELRAEKEQAGADLAIRQAFGDEPADRQFLRCQLLDLRLVPKARGLAGGAPLRSAHLPRRSSDSCEPLRNRP